MNKRSCTSLPALGCTKRVASATSEQVILPALVLFSMKCFIFHAVIASTPFARHNAGFHYEVYSKNTAIYADKYIHIHIYICMYERDGPVSGSEWF